MTVMQNQIDPGTPVDVYDGHRWMSGWVLVGCATRFHRPAGDHYRYEVYQYPKEERSVPVTFVRRTREWRSER